MMPDEEHTRGTGELEERQNGVGAQATFNPLIDELRSEAGGALMTTAASGGTIFTVPSGKVFHIRNYAIWKTGAAGRVQISTSTASGTRRTLIYFSLANSTFLGEQSLKGIVVVASTSRVASVRASSILGRAFVRIGGVLRDRVVGDATT